MEEEEITSRVTRKCLEIKACKYLSNYMRHLVLMRSEIMSTMVRASPMSLYRAFDDMVRLIRNYKMQNAEVEEVCRKILTTPVVWSSDNKSLFIIAQVLAYLILLIKEEERSQVLTTIWVELLMQVTKNSREIMHVKQLISGGELLTFIWLLNKHVKIDDIFDIIVDIPIN
ncbi:hypothetical protein IEQ34_000922 [Dendrobium chrysotoxum]|uniref:Uncharacterized protein n=1 Tax=Dendrobium chrysotoxum TaxID=161865 RepID=A0AAV7H6D0_DENCH|nr:hypothetical protein IEQ34_000922 [Dendrobium chrysotoxum]